MAVGVIPLTVSSVIQCERGRGAVRSSSAMMRQRIRSLLLLAGVVCHVRGEYWGAALGSLRQLQHGVRGDVYAVDTRTLFIKNFHYDGEGPAAFFYVGASDAVNAGGANAWRVRDERGAAGPLKKYRGRDVTLSLPDGKTLRDIKWFAVWCDEFSVNFGDVRIPSDLVPPKPAQLGALSGVHGVSSGPILVVDAQTLLIPDFSYDGEAPDAKFWVGRGPKPSPQGIRIPDENGKESPLKRYDRKTIVLTLPGELTVFDIGHFGVWCEAFTVDFGHVQLPASRIARVPPSLRMLGVSPQSKLNCEVLSEELAFEVRWAVAGDSAVIQLVAKLEDGEYMSFGVSGSTSSSQMVAGDVVVAGVGAGGRGFAVDYYLDAKSQCAGVRGSCPDERLGEKTNSVRMLNAAVVSGYSIVTYQRPLAAADSLDRAILTNASTPIIWAIGPLNSRGEVSYHHHYTKESKFIEFGRPPVWNCPMPETEDEHEVTTRSTEYTTSAPRSSPAPTPAPVSRPQSAWDIPPIQCHEPADGVFYLQMGPTGGKQGYSAITGHVGWGISWYVNGLLIPEISVVRGKRYTFVVEGGNDPAQPAKYHPLYITDDPVGGYHHKTPQEKQNVNIYAGVRRSRSGELLPTGVGRLCNWTPDPTGPPADDFPSFGAYQRSLSLVCEEGSSGVVHWTPDHNTPDTVYYQCFTHRYLGWKINVLDECDVAAEASQVDETAILPDEPYEGVESVQVATRVTPDANYIVDQRKKVERVINTKPVVDDRHPVLLHDPATLTGEVMYDNKPPVTLGTNQLPEFESPITKMQIKQVIEAVENLETNIRDHNAQETHPELFLPERPVHDNQEYSIGPANFPTHLILTPNKKPLTLQSVMRPNSMPHPYRRPTPPDIRLRRPPPGPPHHMPPSPHHMKKPFYKHHNGRPPTIMNRPPINSMTPKGTFPLGPKPLYNIPQKSISKNNGPVQAIIMAKPATAQSQTLNLGQTDIIANHDIVVRSHITLPGNNEPVALNYTYISKPGQIILGKPMESPMPLDQQMIPTKTHVININVPPRVQQQVVPPNLFNIRNTGDEDAPKDGGIKSSDFIGESSSTETLQPAVNTGFKASSIVIESGFKPIIREPLMASEDRIADDGVGNRREDTDVPEDYEESPQHINHAYPSDRMTQSFEPMFIPSPPDDSLSVRDTTKEVFPSNHAKEDRPHPVYVKSETELNNIFSKQNMEKEVPPDMIMEADRVNAQYLPPDPKLPKEQSQKVSQEQTYAAYDGKTVSASTLTETEENTTKLFSEQSLLKRPQFGPFKGEIPSALAAQLGDNRQSDDDTKTTHLKLVNSFNNDMDRTDRLKGEASEVHEARVDADSEHEDEDDEEYEEDDEAGVEDGGRPKRDIKAAQFEPSQVSNKKYQIEYETVNNSATTLMYKSTKVMAVLAVLAVIVEIQTR